MKRYLFALPALVLCLLTTGRTAPGLQGPTISSDLAAHPKGAHLHRVIVQASDSGLADLRRGGFGRLRRDLQDAVAIEVNDAQLEALEHNPLYEHISGDLPVAADMAITNTVTAATTVWQGTPGILGLLGTPGYTGAGVGVAIVDSGIASHTALDTRVVAHVNLVSTEPGVSGDPFGHGTHVAGIVGGNRTAATYVTPAYAGGSAPSVKLVDVRVLGANGSGLTSDVIAGINWAVDHRSTYDIRVINLSLGHPVTEPSTTDPLCQAVVRAVTAGITVVVSGGNYGTTSAGAPVLGGITSPGNTPAALTVGAIDTHGTISASDDTVAPYSSRGPTRYEFAVKPDVVAPGTRIVSLEAQNSYISTTYPQWHIAGSGKNAYIRLSGTSMSTAVVSGGAALLLSAQPSLTPGQVKMAMQMGARFMPAEGLIAAGTGSVNFAQSLKVAQNGLLTTITTTLSNLLGGASGAAFRDYGTLIDRIYDRTGIRLLQLLDLGALFGSADTAEPGVLNLLGTSNPLGSAGANYVVWGNVANWSGSYYVVWGNTMQSPDGQYVVWGNNESSANYVVWGNGAGGGH
ncbi:MAG TPA: S8 family peptidase [Vicinamibacterales bacterium]|jgi:serine protease AprX|nr:S8 family peptidase [Vicinamibacterales bacterium]